MEHSAMFYKIKTWYEQGHWTADMVENAVKKGKITQEECDEILASRTRILDIVKTEALNLRDKFSDDRRTEISDVAGEVDIEDLIPQEECVLTMTNFGYVKRLSVDTYRTQKRGGKGVSGMSKRDEDVASDMFIINSHDYVLFFTNFGRVYRLKCYEIPEGSRTSKGMNIANLLPINSDEKVTSVIRVPEFDDEKYLIMVTKQGLVKRIKLNAYNTNRKGGIVALDLNEDDELAWVKMTDGNSQVIIATKLGKAIRFSEDDVRPMGRNARGVKALTLSENDSVIGMAVVDDDSMLLTVSETGYGRLSSVEDYRVTSRGGKGIINYHTEKYGNVAAISTVNVDEDDIVIISSDGVIIRIEASSVRVCARPSKGVTVMKVNGDNKVVTIAIAPHEEEATDEATQVVEATATEAVEESTEEAENIEE